MKISRRWNIFSLGVKILMGLVVAVLIGSVDVTPASADDHRGREYYGNDHRGQEHYRNDHRGRGYDRGRRHVKYRRGHRTVVYRERVYVEPPVLYAPPPPPGISFFFPPIIFRP